MHDIKPNLNVPIMFQKLKQFETDDTRFIKVKIWLMHLGENLNGSYFAKEIVEPAIPTLSNTPILAYIEDNSDGDVDFSDHRMILVKEEGQIKLKYIGQAIGVIPESNNAQFENRLCDDGVEREFLTVEGLVWQNKWDDAPDILNRDMIKNHSMELHDDYTGTFQEDNLFHFSSFKFYGACALGKNVLPAMHNSTIEVQFSMDNFQKDIQEKMEQFKIYNQNQPSTLEDDNIKTTEFKKGGNGDLNEKIELLAKYNLTVEQINFSIEELSLEDLEIKIKDFTSQAIVEPEITPTPDPIVTDFSLTNSQLISEINKILDTMTVIKTNRWGESWTSKLFYFMDLKDSNVIIVNNDWDTYYGVPFTLSGDSVTMDFDSKVEFVPDWRAKQNGETTNFSIIKEVIASETDKVFEKFEALQTEKSEVETKLNEKTVEFEKTSEELAQLNEYKATKLAEERTADEEALYTKYETLKGVEEFEALKTRSAEFSTMEDLEKEIALIYVNKNVKFSVNPKQEAPKVKVTLTKIDGEESPYGGLFEKYNKNTK